MFGSLALLLAAIAACISEDPGPQPPSCAVYCEVVEGNCKDTNRAFDNREQCMKMCSFMTRAPEGDTTNTVGCRLTGARAGECKRASAYGGGVCGDRCETFCDLVDKQCIQRFGGQPPAPYANKADCVEACRRLTYDETDVEGAGARDGVDTLNCRMLHLILSLDGPETHCPHVAVPSTTCFGDGSEPGSDAGHDGHGGDRDASDGDSGRPSPDGG